MEIVIVLFILSVLYALFQAKIKGIIGEKIVAAALSGLPEEQYRILNDIMLRTDCGTTQIDHVVVSVYGIFVIETKNYKGWITGSEHGDYWTKNMYGKKYSFRNPLKQNYAHVKALEEKTGLPEDSFIPIVAFSSSSEIKVKTKKPVVYIGQLKRVIQEYKEIKFRECELSKLVSKIQNANITTKEARKEHVRQIQTKVQEIDRKAEAGICPRCGGKLVKRRGKNGEFMGCGNYPRCRYTRGG